jgi:hypothetical protein
LGKSKPISSFLVFIGFSPTDHHHPSLLGFSVGVTAYKQRYGPAQTTEFSADGSHLLYIFCGMSICPFTTSSTSTGCYLTWGAIYKPHSSISPPQHRQKLFYFLARQKCLLTR